MGWKDSLKRAASAAASGASRIIRSDAFARVASSLAASATSSALVEGGDPGARRVFLQAIAAGFDKGRDPTDVFEKTLNQHIDEVAKRAEFQHKRFERFVADQARAAAETRAYISEAVENLATSEAREEKLTELMMREQHARAKALDARLAQLQKSLYEVDKEVDNDTLAVRAILLDEAEKLRAHHRDELRAAKAEVHNLTESIAIEGSIAAVSAVPWVGGPITAAAHATHFGMELLQAKSHLDHVKKENIRVPKFDPYDYDVRADIQSAALSIDGSLATEEEKNLKVAQAMISRIRTANEKFSRTAHQHQDRADVIGHRAASRVANAYIQVMRSSEQAIFIPVFGEEPLCAVTVSSIVVIVDPPLRRHVTEWENVSSEPTSLSRSQMKHLMARLRRWPIRADPLTLRKVVFGLMTHGPPRMAYTHVQYGHENETEELTRV